MARRERDRAKSAYGGRWDPADLVDELRQRTPRLGLWLDTSRQTPTDTVQAIVSRLDEAIVDL